MGSTSIVQDATEGRAIVHPWTVDHYHRAIDEGWLEERTAITHKVLAEQLRQLERDGLVERTVSGNPKVRVDYRLSELGTTLKLVLDQMAGWAKRHHGVYGATLQTRR